MILFRIALRNLGSHKLKSFIVGGLLAFGTFLLIFGQALLGTLDISMEKSVSSSVTGHLQAYAADAKDKLAIFGDMNGGTDIGAIRDFARVRAVLETHPDVEAAIPQGIDQAMVYGGNVIDTKLEALRAAEKAHDTKTSAVVRAHVRRIVGLLAQDMAKIGEVTDLAHASTETRDAVADLAKAGSDQFWADFDKDPLAAMEFLENKVAPLALNADMLFFRYMGTDPARYAKAFDLFEMADGEPIPPGQRGFLFNKLGYEEMFKHKTARRLDKMKDRLADGYRIDRDPSQKSGYGLRADDDLKQWIKLNQNQYKEVTYQLDDVAAASVRSALQKELDSKEEALDKLLTAFFDMTDSNFAQRYKLFYDVIAPHLLLYAVRVGDNMTIKGFTASGYPTSVNVKVYGTFRFKSLDKSTLAGAMHVMDLMTYRDLYGYLSADKKTEIEALQKASGVKEIKRENAEDEMFGEGAAGGEVVELQGAAAPGAATAVDAPAAASLADAPTLVVGGSDRATVKLYREQLGKRVYTQAEIDAGVVRNIAIILKKGVDQKKALASIQALVDKEKLNLKIIDWRTASGFIGDFLWVIYSVLATALGIIFIVAIIVMNNSMVMATLERTREIGTMRAIGAQKSMILQMFLAEAVTMAAVFGAAGAGLAGIVVGWLHSRGLPAVNDVLVFLFAGPRLYPSIAPHHLLVAGVLVSLVTLISTLYPAWLAMRVTPLQAMQDAE